MPEVFREKGDIVEIGPDWLARLKAAAEESPLRRSRVCLHSDDDAAVHEMILVLCQDVLFRPHRHLTKAESFHMIEGELDLVIFDEDGTPVRMIRLGAAGTGKTFCYRLNGPLYHALLPRTPYVVFHETTSGPFRRDEAQFAPWAPQEPDALRAFLEDAGQTAWQKTGFAASEAAAEPQMVLALHRALHVVRPVIHGQAHPERLSRVVLLGADGFLGRALRHRLAEDGVAMLPLTSRDVDLRASDAVPALARMLRPTDSIVLLATVKPGRQLDEEALAANLTIGASVCAAVREVGCAHMVYIGSDAVYPYGESPIREQMLPRAASFYSLMHLTREHMLSRIEDMPLAILRLTQVYGTGDPHNAYGPNRMVRSAVQEGRIVLFGSGEETRDHIHAADVASTIASALAMRSQGLVNVASGRSISFAALADLVAELCGGGVRIEHQPRRVPVTHRRFDVTALRSAFPAATHVSLEAGVAQMIREERSGERVSTEPEDKPAFGSRDGGNAPSASRFLSKNRGSI